MRYLILLMSILLLSISTGCTGNRGVKSGHKNETRYEVSKLSNNATHSQQISLNSNAKDKDDDAAKIWQFIMFVLLIILNLFILIVAVIIPLRKYQNKDKIISSILKDYHFEKMIKAQISEYIKSDYSSTERVASNPFITENKINEIVDIVVKRSMECIELNNHDNMLDKSQSIEPVNEHSIKDDIYYLSKQESILLHEVNKDEGVFKVFNINNNEANFEYCGGIVNPDFFTEICIFENNPQEINEIKSIRTTVPGKVKKDENENWKIINKAKIKFE